MPSRLRVGLNHDEAEASRRPCRTRRVVRCEADLSDTSGRSVQLQLGPSRRGQKAARVSRRLRPVSSGTSRRVCDGKRSVAVRRSSPRGRERSDRLEGPGAGGQPDDQHDQEQRLADVDDSVRIVKSLPCVQRNSPIPERLASACQDGMKGEPCNGHHHQHDANAESEGPHERVIVLEPIGRVRGTLLAAARDCTLIAERNPRRDRSR